jgi:c-di-GMP-binding flagellar brake protein YcgR
MSGDSSGDSLDFNNLEGSDLNSATRQFFRVSIGENENYFVKIDEKKYSLVDVSANGVSFFANSGKEFPIGSVLAGCELKFDKESINGLNGKIVHNSSEPVNGDHDTENKWLCGMLWENLDSCKGELLLSGFEILKKDVLANNDVSDMGE